MFGPIPLFGDYLNGKIGTSEFAKPAGDAVFASDRDDLVGFVQIQDFLGAECAANPAALTPVSMDHELLELRFRHEIDLSLKDDGNALQNEEPGSETSDIGRPESILIRVARFTVVGNM